MIHTLLIHSAFTVPNEPGGTRHFEIAQSLTHCGERFSVITSNTGYLTGQRKHRSKKWVIQKKCEGVHVFYVNAHASLHKNYVARVFAFLSFALNALIAAFTVRSVDVVMGTSPPIFQAFSAWLVSRLRRVPFLLEIRDLWPEFAIHMRVLKNPILIFLARRMERFLYNHADHIVVNSPAYKAYIVQKGFSSEKISLVSNGVNPGMFEKKVDPGKVRESFRLNGRFVVTYTGALGEANDIATLLETAGLLKSNPDIHFLIVGDGKERGRLERMAKANKLNNVTFTGVCPKDEICQILAASDVCIATLKDISMFRTTYPNKVFDYMAAGRATVLAIDGVIRQVIEEARAGMFAEPGNPLAIALTILYMYQHPEQVEAMGRNARTFVAKHFNREQQAVVFHDVLKSMIAREISVE